MALVRRSFGRTMARGPRRKTSWSVGPETNIDGMPQGTITASSAVLATSSTVALLDGITLVRLRGEFSAWLITAGGNSEGFSGAFGIGKATAQAIAAGVLSVPTPLTDEDEELWIYHRYFQLNTADAIAAATAAQLQAQVHPMISAVRFEIDSKAMRKFDIGDGLYAAIEVSETGTCSMNWSMNCRTLFKLS